MKPILSSISLIALLAAGPVFAQEAPANLAEAMAQYLSPETRATAEGGTEAALFVNQYCGSTSAQHCLLTLAERLAARSRDVGETVSALQILASVQAQIGEDEAATATYTQAERLIQRRFGGLTKEFAWSALSLSLIDAGRYEAARRVSNQLEKEMGRVQILLEIANAQLGAGDRSTAETTFIEGKAALKAATIRGPRDQTRHYALIELAIGQTRLGQFENAMDTLSEIPDTARRQSGLQRNAEELLALGEVTRAESIVAELTEALPHIRALNALAEHSFKAGNQAEANRLAAQSLAMVEEIEGAGSRGYGLAFVSVTLAKIGQGEAAVSLVSAIERPFEGSLALSVVALELATGGQREAALALFQRAQQKAAEIDHPATQNVAYANIGAKMGQARFLREAFTLAQNTNFNYARSVIFANLAAATEE